MIIIIIIIIRKKVTYCWGFKNSWSLWWKPISIYSSFTLK